MKNPKKKHKLLTLQLSVLLVCFPAVGEIRSDTKILKLTKRRQAVYLTVHHTGSPVKTIPFAEKLRNHQELMWHYTIESKGSGNKITTHVILRDTPYHFIVDSTGEIAEGRELRFAPYSNTEYLTPIDEHITIVLEGDFDKNQPTGAQISSLIGLLADLAKAHDIKLENIGYHQGVVKKHIEKSGRVSYGTSCPGMKLIDRFGEIKAEVSRRGIK